MSRRDRACHRLMEEIKLTDKLINIDELAQLLGGASRTTIYRHIRGIPGFPQPIKLGAATRFRMSDVQRYIRAKPIFPEKRRDTRSNAALCYDWSSILTWTSLEGRAVLPNPRGAHQSLCPVVWLRRPHSDGDARSSARELPRCAMNSRPDINFAKDEHERATRMFGFTLTLGTTDAWLDFSAVAAARLTPGELSGLAVSALTALCRETAAEAVRAVYWGAGPPLPPLFAVEEDASFWADMAMPEELRAYAVACFNRMSPQDRAAFLAQVRSVV